jgi:hypothetical protein
MDAEFLVLRRLYAITAKNRKFLLIKKREYGILWRKQGTYLKLIEETSSSSFRTLKLPFRNFGYKKPDKLLEPENERQKSQTAGIST